MRTELTNSECGGCAGASGTSMPSAEPNTGSGSRRVMFRIPLGPLATADTSRVDSMSLAIIADAAVGTAVLRGRAAGVMAELCIDHVGIPDSGATALDILAEALETGPDTGTGRATIQDDTGAVVAQAMGVVAVDPDGGPVQSRVRPRSFDPPDARLVPLDSDSVQVEIRRDMLNDRGTVHGGVLLGLVHKAQEWFQQCHGVRCRPLRVTIDYLRPALDDRHLVLRSSLERRGRRLWIVRTVILDRSGRTVAVAWGTGAVTAGSIASLELRG